MKKRKQLKHNRSISNRIAYDSLWLAPNYIRNDIGEHGKAEDLFLHTKVLPAMLELKPGTVAFIPYTIRKSIQSKADKKLYVKSMGACALYSFMFLNPMALFLSRHEEAYNARGQIILLRFFQQLENLAYKEYIPFRRLEYPEYSLDALNTLASEYQAKCAKIGEAAFHALNEGVSITSVIDDVGACYSCMVNFNLYLWAMSFNDDIAKIETPELRAHIEKQLAATKPLWRRITWKRSRNQ